MSQPSLLQILHDRFHHSGALDQLEKKLEPGKRGARARVLLTGPREADLSFVAGALHRRRPAPTLLVAHKLEPTERHYDDLEFFGHENVHHYPAWETLPFENEQLNLEVQAKRMDALAHLAGVSLRPDGAVPPPPIVAAPVDALMQKTVPPGWLREHAVAIEWGARIDTAELTGRLDRLGYKETPMVEGRGEYSVRGGIVDIFSLQADHPVRLDLFGDELESIRFFDLATQRSITDADSIERVVLLPADERHMISLALREGVELVPLLDYFPQESLVVQDAPELFNQMLGKFQELVEYEADQIKAGKLEWEDPTGRGRRAPEPREQFLEPADLMQRLHEYTTIASTRLGIEDAELAAQAESAGLLMREAELHSRGFGDLKPDLETYLGVIRARQHEDYLVTIVCDNEGQVMRFEELLREREIGSLVVKNPAEPTAKLRLTGPLEGYPEVVLTVGTLSAGFVLPEAHTLLITDREVFGRYKRRHVYRKIYKGQAVRSVEEIQRGDCVVHVEHGVGKFLGLRRQELDGEPVDLIEILYKDDDRLLVPVDKVQYVQKYSAQEGSEPALDKLGGKRWQQRKKKSTEEVEKLAKELLALYAEREAARGHAFEPDTHRQREFEASFLYQETEDQLTAIEAVKQDMEGERPMDRLVCGDVGYGKTEVAIRAAFKAIQDDRQVAMLCPTTILAQQHFMNFQERFADYPIRLELLSRFRTRKEQNETLARLKKGECDMVIGTHRLLGKDVVFADLGLLIIDEEQRFGVAHKEKLKSLRTEVDVMTLTATPIPRTLYMALSGLRDMSLIATPPADRYPIRTRVISFQKDQIEEAILRELNRGGQVYFVHNRVHNIDDIRERLREIVPDARIAVAHGQMNEHELEEVMVKFIDGQFDILLATTIIENGLDIPNCNTIIINRADAFGLAQLYQLRGRVGRSTRRSYAYLIVPEGQAISDAAVRRLEAIQEFTDLGMGFQVALRDMEIRGTGNILGAEQSGTMEAVGFELYCNMLETAVHRLKGEGVGQAPAEVEVVWRAPAFIPPEYIPVESQRLNFYKRVAGARREKDLDQLGAELRDRYGQLPESVENVLHIARLRVLAAAAGARRVVMTTEGFKLEPADDPVRAMAVWNKLVADHPGVADAVYGQDGLIAVSVKAWAKGRRLEKAVKVLRAFLHAVEGQEEARRDARSMASR